MPPSSYQTSTTKPNPKGFEAFVKRSISPNIRNYKDSVISAQRYGNHPSLLQHQQQQQTPSPGLGDIGAVPASKNSDMRFFQNGHVYNSLPPLHQVHQSKVVPPLRSYPFSQSPNDIDFPIPLLETDTSGVDFYKHFKSENKALRDPISWENADSSISNKPSITRSFNEILMSKFDKPAQQYIKDYLIQEEDVSEKNRKDDKIFSSLNERDKNNSVMLLSREEFKNGKPRKSELKYLEKSELRKALKLHGEEENIFNEDGGFNKQIGPRQLKNLHKAELEREEFLKMSRDVRRQKFKLMRVVENGYRSGVLNAEDDYGVFAKSSQQLKEKQNRAMVHTVTRKECKLLEKYSNRIT